ncbi:MAG: ribokinase [Luteolibacter sp.]
MKKPDIVVIGSSNTDMIIRAERIPKPGETILGGRFLTAHGGKGANQAVAASRAGGQVTFVARVGSDVFGDEAISAWRSDGISVEHVSRDAMAPSGVALIFVSKKGENSIAVAPGANGELSVSDVGAARDAMASAKVCVIQLETPLATVEAAAKLATELGVRVILNPAPARALPARLLKNVSVLTPNESEAELLTGIAVRDVASAKKAAAALLAKGVRTVVLTLGSRGALIADRDGSRMVPGFKVKAVDTTAAGDVFNGALAVALAEGQSLDDAVRFANAAAALSVTKAGAQPSAPRRLAIKILAKKGE